MNEEFVFPESGGFEGAEEVLDEIKNCSIMLTVGTDYLCEKVFLRKMGEEVEDNLGLLEKFINELKGQFVGRPAREMDLREEMNELAGIASFLKKAEEKCRNDCSEGRLGRELNEKLLTLRDKVRILRSKFEGETVSYSTKERAVGLIARLRFVYSWLMETFRFGFKVAALLLMICLAAFGFLFFSMEQEDAVIGEIKETSSLIHSDERELSRINEEIDKLQAAITELERNRQDREDEVEIMDLRVKEHSLIEKREEVIIEKEKHSEALERLKKRLKEIREKTFIERLLRR